MPTRLPLISIARRKRHFSTSHRDHLCDLCKAPRTIPYYRIQRSGKHHSNVIKYWCEPCTGKHYLTQLAYIRLTGETWIEPSYRSK